MPFLPYDQNSELLVSPISDGPIAQDHPARVFSVRLTG